MSAVVAEARATVDEAVTLLEMAHAQLSDPDFDITIVEPLLISSLGMTIEALRLLRAVRG